MRHRSQSVKRPVHSWPTIIITVTSWWAWWRFESPASRLFSQPFIQAQIKENIKAPRHWPLWGEFTGARWIPQHKWPVTQKMFPFDEVIMMNQLMYRIYKQTKISQVMNALTHRSLDTLTDILQTTLSKACINNYTHHEMWDEITYPFPNFNGCTIEVWEWISNCIPQLTRHWLLIHAGIKATPC